MAMWGPKLYQNDIAEDVRLFYKDQLKYGKTNEEVTALLIDEYQNEISDNDDAPNFWFALADTQWELGKLLLVVKENAINWLDKSSHQEQWLMENPKYEKMRIQTLTELRNKLNSPMPPEKKISQNKLYKSEWKHGDVFAYKLSSSYAEVKGFLNQYIYFVMVDNTVWHPGHIVPNVYVYNCVTNELLDAQKVKKIMFMPQFYKKQVYINNPNQKKLYFLTLLSTSKNVIPHDHLFFIGNIGVIKGSADEDINTFKVTWKNFEKYIIENMIEWLP